jgi:hypothetical protein
MHQGRGGMGSHKHGISGYATKSPRFRHSVSLENDRDCKAKEARKRKVSANLRNVSVTNLFKHK